MSGLEHLDPLVGEWRVAIDAPRHVDEPLTGSATFEWLGDRGFLVHRSTVDHPLFPDGLVVIGGDPLKYHYFDTRGVQRIYDFSFEDGVMTIERHDPDMTQRFVGRLTEDGTTIDGSWEFSDDDGSTWKRDFVGTYTRVS
jgi:hypothetical protein